MATEYTTTNNGNQEGLGSELEEPRRTTEQQGFGVREEEPRRTTEQQGFGVSEEEPRRTTEQQGFGVSEEEPPHHKIHTDDEPLPKPQPGTYDEEEMPKPVAGSPAGYQEDRDTAEDRTKLDESPVESQPRSYGTEEGRNGDYADPSEAFARAPVDTKVEEPGYGYDQKTSEPVTTEATPTSATGAPKKEGLMTKIKEKLPGLHAKPADSAVEHHDTTATEHAGAPKKGLMAKIKEKMPGHHSTTGTTAAQ